MRETLGLRIRTKDISLIVFQPEHIVETATRLVASVADDGDISHASWDDAEEKDKP